MKIGRMNQRLLIEEHDDYTKDDINGYTDTWFPFYSANDVAEVGTNTTTLKLTLHGLETGDYIINSSRSNTVRIVTKVDVNTVTVSAIVGQIVGDVIKKRIRTNSIVWGAISPSSGVKHYADERVMQEVTHKITIRYRNDIKTQFRLRLYPDLTRIFEIIEVLDTDEANKQLIIRVKEVIA